ncbi:type II toxin-antitoxin system RelE/ParE family toxin [Sulfuricurvum sp.]|uniref:type II toxin-antitoxin system RelE/ParE family toxin n=1 Tax=Sulfuricurvum sp. TaxID=2025608 RepID=UPI00261B72A9|nr:type II toxin-antitoxin system RelE/ParE family toxin [Sulfuricurvum sp.]MDD4950646.1 type II toxin-antitoxin system RelE/ParE family toxin [Sulfuricurvum sp.]
MKWEIEFFNEAVEADTLSFPAKILAKMLHIFEMIQEHGPNLGKPYTDAFGDGLFEVRAKGAEGIGRSFFCYASGKKIIILHSFVKKTQKTPQKEIKIALKRKKEINHDK